MPSTQKSAFNLNPVFTRSTAVSGRAAEIRSVKSGGDYIKACTQYAKKIGLPILTSHKVTSIIREKPDSGRVLGVEVDLGNGKKNTGKLTKV